MTEEMVMQIGQNAITTMVYLAGPVLLAAMAVGIVISILQAITQINEQTLTFIPKMIAVILTLVVMAPWMLRVLQDYAISIFGGAGEMIH
ncbi:MAG: flagellar biosynthesis protein FliQ [Bdellovibrionales bacterium]|nr:flagellar biosynthesis protein FliQ [Bdellovibrionales bacterium]